MYRYPILRKDEPLTPRPLASATARRDLWLDVTLVVLAIAVGAVIF